MEFNFQIPGLEKSWNLMKMAKIMEKSWNFIFRRRKKIIKMTVAVWLKIKRLENESKRSNERSYTQKSLKKVMDFS